MKISKVLRTSLILALALLMVVSIAACGKKDSSSSSSEASSAAAGDEGGSGSTAAQVKTETWGNITVAVPEGMTFKGGSVGDENDLNAVSLTEEGNAWHYFLITAVDSEDNAKSSVETTREVNDGVQDITVDANTQWTGVTYDYSGSPVFLIYGTVDGRVVIVQSYGYAADSDISKEVLDSLKIAASAE